MSTPLANRFARAAAQVETYLHTQSTRVSILPPGEFPKGWTADISVNGANVTLHVLLSRDFPSVPPRIRVTPPEKFYLHIPHVESDGLLCLYPSGVEFNTDEAAAGIALTWTRARELLEKPNLADFFDEFSSYWRLNTGTKREVLSLFPGETPSTSFAFSNERTIVVGETESALKQWWKNHKGEPKVMPNPIPVRRVDLAKPIYPHEFPGTVADFVELIRKQDPALATRFFESLAQSAPPPLVILRIPTSDGFVEGAVELPALNLANRIDVKKGFRSGRVPLHVVQSRGNAVLRQSSVARFNLQPIVHRYIHSRGGNGTDLAQKSVVVVGCGSLGGYIAHFFAKAGVGRLTMIDPELLGWDNAGRHILGGRFVGLSKAKSLAHVLRSEMPHLRIESFAASWREVHDYQSLVFSNCDLIVSTVGSWTAEHDLNHLLRKGDLEGAGLFTWIEPHAVAGHAVLVHPMQGGCMECVSDSWGTFAMRTCDVPPQAKPAGCAGAFQPYGVAEMIPTASLAVQTGVDYLVGRINASESRSWLGPKTLFDQHGLTLFPAWADKLARQPYGSIYHEALAPLATCRCCH